MKLTNIFCALAFGLVFASCSSDDPETTPTVSFDSQGSQVSLTYDITESGSLPFYTTADWTVSDVSSGLTVSPLSGKSGSNTVSVKASEYNSTNEDCEYSFTITSKNSAGAVTKTIKVVQDPVFSVESLSYSASGEGDTIDVAFNTDGDLDDIDLYYDTRTSFLDMMGVSDDSDNSSSAKGFSQLSDTKMKCLSKSITHSGSSKYKYYYEFVVTPNKTSSQRYAGFYLVLNQDKSQSSEYIEIVQNPATVESSTDMTEDGKTATLLTHTKGNGVPIVIMGDGFLDTDITSGKYREAMQKACDYLFTIHPMKALKDYFDVYEVTAVSKNNTFSTSTSTAFSSKFAGGNSTEITGDDDKAITYAEKAVSKSNIDNALILIILNDTRYAGTCSVYRNNSKGDIPGGYSVAYIPMVANTSVEGTSFEEVLHHEAVGHGFAKLADEYYYKENGTITSDDLSDVKDWMQYGFYRNISLSSDVTASYWADFASDSQYASENLSCYEGAYTYMKGVYRPTQTSIMNDNCGGFNAPSRMMIYKRCMRIAMGSSWKYDQSTFTAFDLQNSSSTSSSAKGMKRNSRTSLAIRPLGRPIMHKYTR